MKKLGFIIILSIFMVPIIINADDYKKSDSFFDTKDNGSFFGNNNDNFFDKKNTLTPLEKEQHNSVFKKNDLFKNDRNYFNKGKKLDKKDAKKESKTKSIQNIFGDYNNTDLVSGNKIITLGLVVNSINKVHFENVMEKFRKTVDDFDLDAGHVYINGHPDSGLNPVIMPLVARGSRMSFHFTMPEEFNISISPTWIIQTSEGRILLEGVSNLNRYINKKGEFVENGVPTEQRFFDHDDNSEDFKGISIFGD